MSVFYCLPTSETLLHAETNLQKIHKHFGSTSYVSHVPGVHTPGPNVVSNKIIVSNKLSGSLQLGLGLGFGSGFILYARNCNPNKLLELLNVVTNNFIGLQRWDRLPHTLPARETVFPIRNRQGMFRGLPTLENICQNTVHSTHSAGTAERNLERGGHDYQP